MELENYPCLRGLGFNTAAQMKVNQNQVLLHRSNLTGDVILELKELLTNPEFSNILLKFWVGKTLRNLEIK